MIIPDEPGEVYADHAYGAFSVKVAIEAKGGIARLLRKGNRWLKAARLGSQSMGSKRRRTRSFRCGFGSCLMHQTDSSCYCQHLRNTNEIVGCGGEHEEPLDQAAATMPGRARASIAERRLVSF